MVEPGSLSLVRLEDFLNLTSDAVIGIDQDQRIFLFNKSAERIFGYVAEETLGQPLDLLIPRRFVEIHRDHIRAFSAAPEVFLGHARPDGNFRQAQRWQ